MNSRHTASSENSSEKEGYLWDLTETDTLEAYVTHTGPTPSIVKGTHSCHSLQEPTVQLQREIYSCGYLYPASRTLSAQRPATPDFQTCCSETCKSCNTSPGCNTPNSSRLASCCWWEFRSHCSICHSCLVTYFFLFKVINPKLIKFHSCMHPLLSAHLNSKARTQLDTGDGSLLAVLEGHCTICWCYKKNIAEE